MLKGQELEVYGIERVGLRAKGVSADFGCWIDRTKRELDKLEKR
jgi:hypothetical protein